MNSSIISIVSSRSIPDSFWSGQRLSSGYDVAARIIEAVRLRGDEALHEYTAQFERAQPGSFEIPAVSLKIAAEKLERDEPELFSALCVSRDHAREFALRQRKSWTDFEMSLAPGMYTGQKTIPVERAGLYVPAGRFPLFSSVIMGSAPAYAAGVDQIWKEESRMIPNS